jgi:hypothetical protein
MSGVSRNDNSTRRTDMQIKKLALIGFSALALTAYGFVFAGEDEAAKEKAAKDDAADVAQEYAEKKQEDAEAAVRADAPDAKEKVGEAAAAKAVSSEMKEEAAK